MKTVSLKTFDFDRNPSQIAVDVMYHGNRYIIQGSKMSNAWAKKLIEKGINYVKIKDNPLDDIASAYITNSLSKETISETAGILNKFLKQKDYGAIAVQSQKIVDEITRNSAYSFLTPALANKDLQERKIDVAIVAITLAELYGMNDEQKYMITQAALLCNFGKTLTKEEREYVIQTGLTKNPAFKQSIRNRIIKEKRLDEESVRKLIYEKTKDKKYNKDVIEIIADRKTEEYLASLDEHDYAFFNFLMFDGFNLVLRAILLHQGDTTRNHEKYISHNVSKDVINMAQIVKIASDYEECLMGPLVPKKEDKETPVPIKDLDDYIREENALTPEKAFNHLATLGGVEYQEDLLDLFKKGIPFYDLGDVVYLSNGQQGIVTKLNIEDSTKPSILIMYNNKPVIIDLSEETWKNVELIKENDYDALKRDAIEELNNDSYYREQLQEEFGENSSGTNSSARR